MGLRRSGTQDLPVEILVAIFSKALPVSTPREPTTATSIRSMLPLNVMGVCRDWREVILSHKKLCAVISLNLQGAANYWSAARYLKRTLSWSAGASLRVMLRVEDKIYSQAASQAARKFTEILNSARLRWRDFALSGNEYVTNTSVLNWQEDEQENMANMRSLSIHHLWCCDSLLELISLMPNLNALAIREITLMRPDDIIVRLDQLRCLDVRGTLLSTIVDRLIAPALRQFTCDIFESQLFAYEIFARRSGSQLQSLDLELSCSANATHLLVILAHLPALRLLALRADITATFLEAMAMQNRCDGGSIFSLCPLLSDVSFATWPGTLERDSDFEAYIEFVKRRWCEPNRALERVRVHFFTMPAPRREVLSDRISGALDRCIQEGLIFEVSTAEPGRESWESEESR